MTNFHILTLFPEMVLQGLHTSILGRAVERNCISIEAVNIRDYTLDKHGKVDDYTYGGGAGPLWERYFGRLDEDQQAVINNLSAAPEALPAAGSSM